MAYGGAESSLARLSDVSYGARMILQKVSKVGDRSAGTSVIKAQPSSELRSRQQARGKVAAIRIFLFGKNVWTRL
jgi:hypothetical protein